MDSHQDIKTRQRFFQATGLTGCYDSTGAAVDCLGSGQDAEYSRGGPWPSPRFDRGDAGVVIDRLTGLEWTADASPAVYPMTWIESLDFIRDLNQSRHLGHDDWRLPNRREMRSLISHGARNPALPPDHPFESLVVNWYWTSTTSARATGYAWYVHMAGGRMFYGRKDGAYMLWPVRGASDVIPRTGQRRCFDLNGETADCAGTGQDGEIRAGAAWPEPRFETMNGEVLDRLTGLVWHRDADLTKGPCTWDRALEAVRKLGMESGRDWRLPNINELESLVDASESDPALPAGHPFEAVSQAYWSSTTSYFEPDWSYCLYMHKGAVGVGHKPGPEFAAWPVRDS